MKDIFLHSRTQLRFRPEIGTLESLRSPLHNSCPLSPPTRVARKTEPSGTLSLPTGHRNTGHQLSRTASDCTLILDQLYGDMTTGCDIDNDFVDTLDMNPKRPPTNSHNNDDGSHPQTNTASSISSKLSGRSSSVSSWKSRLFTQGHDEGQLTKPSLDAIDSMEPQMEDEYPMNGRSKELPIKNSMDLVSLSERKKTSRKMAAVSSEEEQPTISKNYPGVTIKHDHPLPKALRADADDQPILGRWFDFNDDVITEVDPTSFKNVFEGQECAYMLFYQRVTV